MSTPNQSQAAPPSLEPIRALLNTWWIPNDTRLPRDDLDVRADDLGIERAALPDARRLRDELRRLIAGVADGGAIDVLIRRNDVRPSIAAGAVVYTHRHGPVGDLLARVLLAVGDGTWSRLKACPDCGWVFYDHSRNASKRWCLMNASGAGGRGCGNIAKARRHRERMRV